LTHGKAVATAGAATALELLLENSSFIEVCEGSEREGTKAKSLLLLHGTAEKWGGKEGCPRGKSFPAKAKGKVVLPIPETYAFFREKSVKYFLRMSESEGGVTMERMPCGREEILHTASPTTASTTRG
jgi:hypothetical protein